MERKDIHLQISSIIDKISYLNKNLSKEKTLHRVELDLLRSYNIELQELIQQLDLQKSSLTEKEEIPGSEEMTPEPVAKAHTVPEKEIPISVEEEEKVEQVVEEHKERGQEADLFTSNIEEPIMQEVTSEPDHQEVEKTEEMLIKNEGQGDEINRNAISSQKEEDEKSIISVESFNTDKIEEEEHVSLNERFKISSFEVADKLKFGDRKNLKDKIDLNERYIFIKELFEGDAEHFNRSLRELDQCSSMDEAQHIIKTTIEEKYSWEEKQKYASRFIELVLNNFDDINNN